MRGLTNDAHWCSAAASLVSKRIWRDPPVCVCISRHAAKHSHFVYYQPNHRHSFSRFFLSHTHAHTNHTHGARFFRPRTLPREARLCKSFASTTSCLPSYCFTAVMCVLLLLLDLTKKTKHEQRMPIYFCVLPSFRPLCFFFGPKEEIFSGTLCSMDT